MPSKLPLTDVLRNTIVQSGTTFRELERATGVKRQSLMKFIRGEQSLRLDMADKLVAHFGLELTQTRKTNRKSK